MRSSVFLTRIPAPVRTYAALITTCALLAFPAAAPTLQAAGEVEVSKNVSQTGESLSEAPQIGVGGGTFGISWGERQTDSVGTVDGAIDGDPSGPKILDTGTNSKTQWPDIAVGNNGTEHLVYAVDGDIFYRQRSRGANWSNAVKVASDAFPNPTRIAVAPNGALWIIWRDQDGTHVGYRTSTNNGAGWSGGNVFAESGNMFSPDIAVGPDNVPHVVWHLRQQGAANTGEIRYADWNGSGWTVGKLTNDGASAYDEDANISVDGSNVQHIVWRKFAGDINYLTYASRAPGGDWTGFTPLAQQNSSFQYAPGIGTDSSGSVFVTQSTLVSSGRRVYMTYKLSGQANWSTFEPVSDGTRDWETRSDVEVSDSDGVIRAHVVYQSELRSAETTGEIQYKRIRFGSVGPNADPVLNNGAAALTTDKVTLTFNNVSGDPSEVRWKWNAEPNDADTDSSGWQSFSSSLTIDPPANLTPAACRVITLFTQVRKGDTLQKNIKNDNILYDRAAQAIAYARNPHMDGRLAMYSQGASNGEWNSTRENFVSVNIANMGDCAGLKSYSFSTTQTSDWPTNQGDVAQNVSINPNYTPGPRPPFVTTVSDKLDNKTEQSTIFVYDPLNPLQSDGNTVARGGAPKINAGDFSISSENALLRTLTFSNVSVDDSVYGAATGRATGSQFWGVWVATSKGSAPLSESEYNSDTLLWTPIQVTNPGPSFSVKYPLLSGLPGGTSGKEGTYWVYVKFLDGAGNPSTETLAPQQADLAAGYSTIKVFMPFARK